MSSVVWAGSRGEDATMFDALGCTSGIVCCDWSAGLEQRAQGIPVHSLERDSGRRLLWSSDSLHRLAGSLPKIADAVLVPYRAGAWFESRGLPVLAARSDLVEPLDDKLVQRQLFRDLGLHTPRWQPFGSPTEIAFPAILQTRRGSLGRTTFAVASMEDAGPIVARFSDALLLSERIEGPVVNATAVVTNDDVVVAWPSLQLTGVTECGVSGPFAYCGNDFAAASLLPSMAVDDLFDIMTSIGTTLRGRGYRGIFGADFIFDGTSMVALELNPRFQGSTAQLCALEAAAGVSPISLVHLAAFGLIAKAPRDDARLHPLFGSEIVVWNAGPPFAARDVRLISPVSFVGFPIPNTLVDAGAAIGRLRMSEGVLAGTSLTELAAVTVTLISQAVR